MKREEEKKTSRDITNQLGAQIGNVFSANVQQGTNASIDGMNLFSYKASKMLNVGYEQAKGNLFEYIENAKLSRNLANAGFQGFDRIPLTDASSELGGFGEPHAPDDFRFIRNGKIVGRGQAKVNNDPHRAAVNFTNPKYTGMQRVAPSDVVDDIKKELDNMLSKGEISRAAYEDASKNLRRALTDEASGTSSGGTSMTELAQFRGEDGKVSKKAVESYARRFEMKQYAVEIGTTTAFGAVSNAVVSGIVSGTQHLFEVFQDKKELDVALKEIGADVVSGSVRGGAVGFLSSILRIGGTKTKIPVVSDSSAATVIAGGIIDGGVAIYEYGKGEITAEELKESLQNTVVKSTATIYFTKAISTVVGKANPFIPMAIYSAASYVVTCTREIIKNAKLNAQEYRRLATLNEETAKLVIEFREYLEKQMRQYADSKKKILQGFLNDFDYNLQTGENYDKAIYSIINFANETNLALQHIDFDEFSKAMLTDEKFILK